MKLTLFQNESRHMAVSLESLPSPIPHSRAVPGTVTQCINYEQSTSLMAVTRIETIHQPISSML